MVTVFMLASPHALQRDATQQIARPLDDRAKTSICREASLVPDRAPLLYASTRSKAYPRIESFGLESLPYRDDIKPIVGLTSMELAILGLTYNMLSKQVL